MLHAMMELSVSLLAARAPSRRTPVAKADLLRRLRAIEDPDWPAPLTPGVDCDLEIHRRSPRESNRRRWALAGSGGNARVRLLLDDSRAEVRVNESAGSYRFFVGRAGWLPVLRGSAGAAAGPPGAALVDEIGEVARRAGWTMRPVVWRSQATHRGLRVRRMLVPEMLRRWSPRRFWGVLYPASFAAAIAVLVTAAGPLSRSQWLVLGGVVAAWWLVWTSLMWVLGGFRRSNH